MEVLWGHFLKLSTFPFKIPKKEAQRWSWNPSSFIRKGFLNFILEIHQNVFYRNKCHSRNWLVHLFQPTHPQKKTWKTSVAVEILMNFTPKISHNCLKDGTLSFPGRPKIPRIWTKNKKWNWEYPQSLIFESGWSYLGWNVNAHWPLFGCFCLVEHDFFREYTYIF